MEELRDAENITSTESTPLNPSPIKLYRRRWVMLGIFSFITMMNEVIWISLSSIASIVKDYYQVSNNAVNWLAMVFSLVYVFAVVSVYVLNKFGLKVTIIAGACCNLLACVLRLAGYTRNGYVLVFTGTAVGGIGQCFLIFVPPTLAAEWFGEAERATASSIGMLMNMLGVAIGFLMGSMLIPNVKDYDGAVKSGIFNTQLIQAVSSFVLLIAAVSFIHRAPLTPPSLSQKLKTRDHYREIGDNEEDQGTSGEENYHFLAELIRNIKFLVRSSTFHLLIQAYGICFGLFGTLNSVLNSMCIRRFPGQEKIIGMMGFTSVLLGVIAMMLSGILIDRTHRYKLLSLYTWIGTVVTFLLFTISLTYTSNLYIVFICYCAYGVCSYPYLSIGLEYAAELLYPIKESTLSFIALFVGTQYAVAMTYLVGSIIKTNGATVAGFVISGIYLIGVLCVAMISGELKRFKVDMEQH